MRLPTIFLYSAILLGGVAASFGDEIAATNMNPGFVGTGWAGSVGYTDRAEWRNEAAGQLFTSARSGKLSTLHATVDRFEGGEPLIVSIHAANFSSGVGLPGTLLGSLNIPESAVTKFPPSATWDLSSLNIDLVAGASYVVTFKVATPLYESTRYRALLTETNANSFGVRALYSKDGVSWIQNPPAVYAEIGLIVSVASPPSPPPPLEVDIDVLPGNVDNKINLNAKKPKPLDVAVFGATDFDVLSIQPDSVRLGDPVLTDPDTGSGVKVEPDSLAYEDVDGDGELDLLLSFDVLTLQNFGAIDAASRRLELDASLDNQGTIIGSDAVSIASSKGKGKK